MLVVIDPPAVSADTTAMLKIGLFLSQNLKKLRHPVFANGRTSFNGRRYEAILCQLLGLLLVTRTALHDIEAFGRVHELKLGEFRAKVVPLARLLLEVPEERWPIWWYLVRDKKDPCRIHAVYLFTTRALIEDVGLDEELARDELRLASSYRRRRPALFEFGPEQAKKIAQMVVTE